eukprot:SAG11_NODE_18_length_25850_cov_18.210050_9_plen_145_part_00
MPFRLYRANISKASAGEQDNQPLIDEILTLRAELSVLLGFECYAEVSTSRKMAQTPAAVLQMTEQLHQKAHPAALRELEELQHFAGESAPLANCERVAAARPPIACNCADFTQWESFRPFRLLEDCCARRGHVVLVREAEAGEV